MRVVISGATGLIGRHVVAALRARGDEVVALSRDADRAARSLGVTAHAWDPMSVPGPPPTAALDGADAIIHLAGESIADKRWSEARKRAIRDSRVVGTRHLVDGIAAMHKKPRVLVAGSAVGYYGDRAGIVDETASPGSDFLAGVVVAWEAEARRASELGVRVVLLRTGIVLAKEGGALAKMLGPFKLGVGGRVGSGKQGFPWIHLADEVGLVLHAIDRDAVVGPMNAAAPEAVDNAAFTKALGRALHRPTVLPVPGFALKAIFGELAEALLGGCKAAPTVAERTGYRFQLGELDAALSDLVG